MANECLKQCPRIQATGDNLTLSNPAITVFEGFPFPFASNEMANEIYRATVQDSEKCPGPVQEVILVRKGPPWNRRTVQERRLKCGLDQQPSPCAIPSELVEV